MTSIISSTFLETGPIEVFINGKPSASTPPGPNLPFLEILLPVGLNPYIPLYAAGILILPKLSEQTPKGVH
jgi:hypothetical protein